MRESIKTMLEDPATSELVGSREGGARVRALVEFIGRPELNAPAEIRETVNQLAAITRVEGSIREGKDGVPSKLVASMLAIVMEAAGKYLKPTARANLGQEVVAALGVVGVVAKSSAAHGG